MSKWISNLSNIAFTHITTAAVKHHTEEFILFLIEYYMILSMRQSVIYLGQRSFPLNHFSFTCNTRIGFVSMILSSSKLLLQIGF